MNKEVINNLLKIFRENKFSHAYLFETIDIEFCYKELIKLIKKILCQHEYDSNCNKCQICHLIDENNLPSIITIEPDGKFIKKEAIENLKKTFSLQPTYIPYNIYIIKYAEKMNDTAYNRMLKFLEEPEDNILGFFITSNKDNIANTILSRVEIVKLTNHLNYNDRVKNYVLDDYDKISSIAEEYYNKLMYNNDDILWFNNVVVLKELNSQEQIVCLLNLIYNKYELNFHQSLDRHIIDKLNIINKYLNQLSYNVNTSLLLDSFALEIGE